MNADWSNVALVIAVTIIIVLFAGEPDLIGAIIEHVRVCK